MKNSDNYYKQREINCLNKIDEITKDLPPYVYEFTIGRSDYTSPLTRLNYCLDIRIFFDYLTKTKFRGKNYKDITLLDLENLTLSDFEIFLAYLSHYTINGKEETNNERGKARKLAAVRAFFKYLYFKGYIKSNVSSKVSLPKLHDKEIVKLDVNEMTDLVNLVENGENLTSRQRAYHKNTKIRDVAIIMMFLGTGIRNSELVGLNVEDINFKDLSFVVTRKGGNRTILYISEEVATALQNWISYRNEIKDLNPNEKALFLSLQNTRISTRTLQQLVKKYAKVVTPLKKITPHKLRSTFGTNLYNETGDIYLVADFLGHSDVNTTKKHYAAMSEELRRKAIKSVKIRDDE
ncbi:MAG: tyrosine-type recombinase/integrase [Clostridia bacterium]|nr:tyrosine-type recombinase/integrase [Clostridia bacterium]